MGISTKNMGKIQVNAGQQQQRHYPRVLSPFLSTGDLTCPLLPNLLHVGKVVR